MKNFSIRFYRKKGCQRKYVKVYVDISAYSCSGIKVIQYKHAESLEDLL